MDEINDSVIKIENEKDFKENIDINFEIKKKILQLTTPILASIDADSIKNFKFFNENHYEDHYFHHYNKQGQSEDMCVRVHTNKLMLLTLAKGNDIVLSGKKITEISFVINNIDRSKVSVVGKKKYGAKFFHPESILCQVKLEGEEQMRNVRSGISGNLVEINEEIKKNPNLLLTNPKGCGYLAVIMPKGHSSEFNLKTTNPHLMSEEDYSNLLLSRNAA